jgi:flagellar assembly protein FliH
MSSAPAKFRFDLDLGHRQERNTVVTETGLAALVANARAEGRAEGLAEAERSANSRALEQLASAARALADHAAALNAAIDDHRNATLTEAIGVASSIGRKLAHHLLADHPTAELEALIAECLASLDAVPHLVVRCSATLADAVRDIAESRIAASGFTGRLVVLGDPDVGPDDVRVEWADGGLIRDRAALEAEIDRCISDYLAARRGAHAKGSFP